MFCSSMVSGSAKPMYALVSVYSCTGPCVVREWMSVTVTRSSLAWRFFGARHDVLDLLARRHLQTEVVDRAPGRRALGRQEEDELPELAGVEDERVPALAGVVALGPAEDVAVEVEDLGAAGVVERGGIHRDRHMVETGPVLGLGLHDVASSILRARRLRAGSSPCPAAHHARTVASRRRDRRAARRPVRSARRAASCPTRAARARAPTRRRRSCTRRGSCSRR